MTKFKVYRINYQGQATITIAEAFDWVSLINQEYCKGDSIFRIDIIGGKEPEELKDLNPQLS